MNHHSPILPAAVAADSRSAPAGYRDRRAFISLALTQRRLSRQYRAWASDDETAGKLDAYRINKAEADRLVRHARFYIACARRIDIAETRIAA